MLLSNGKYFIRYYLDDKSKFWYISGPPQDVQEGQDTRAIVKCINRDTRNTKIRERDLAPECFVDVLYLADGKGTVLLYQTATGRYAAVFREQDEDPPKIAFLNSSFDTIEEDAKFHFQLVSPSGAPNDAFGVAIRSVGNSRFVEIELGAPNDPGDPGYLSPVLDELSHENLVIFELRFGYF